MGFNDLNLPKPKGSPKCEKCNDTGVVKEKDGKVHTCWDCLMAGRLDVHTKELKGSGLKI